MKLSKIQKAIIWAMVLIIVVALGMGVSMISVGSGVTKANYKAYDLYGIRLYVGRIPEGAVPSLFRGVGAYYVFAYHKYPITIATLLIGIACLLTIGGSRTKKGKKDNGLGA
jgi:hypothetical protein